MRLGPEFEYPKYNGRRASAAHTFSHQLVLLIRITLLHAITKMTITAKLQTLQYLDPAGEFQTQMRRLLSAGQIPPEFDMAAKGAARVVPAKVFAVPGRLSRDEYFSLPAVFMMADGIANGLKNGTEMSHIGTRWGLLAQVQAVVEKSRFLQEYDCDS